MATPAMRVVRELTQPERAALFERWIAKVDRRRGNDACWKWRGAKSQKRNGKRGVIRVGGAGGRIMSAARVGKILATGAKFNDPDIATREICHIKCNNGGNDIDCVNPRHTTWGTRLENESHKQQQSSKKALQARWAKGKGAGRATSKKRRRART